MPRSMASWSDVLGRGSALAALCWLAGPSVAHAAIGPVGQVVADCTGVSGWGQDPDVPDVMIAVHLYFDGPAGDPAATGIPLSADKLLQGGCRGVQCMHGFHSTLPLSRLDGVAHTVHAYGIDTADPNLELTGSPATYTCPPLAITGGVKRHIAGPSILDLWAFSTYFDLMNAADLALAVVPEGTVLDGPPQLVVAEGTTEPLWLIDQGFRRAIAPEQVAPWRFVTGNAVPMPEADLNALPEGSALTERPILVRGTGPKVYLLDEHQCAPGDPDPSCPAPVEPTTGSDSSGAEDSGESGDSDSTGTDDSGGAATSATTSGRDTGDAPTGSASSGEVTESTGGATDAPEDDGGAGCGCRSRTEPSGWALLLTPLLVLTGRRRSRRR